MTDKRCAFHNAGCPPVCWKGMIDWPACEGWEGHVEAYHRYELGVADELSLDVWAAAWAETIHHHLSELVGLPGDELVPLDRVRWLGQSWPGGAQVHAWVTKEEKEED